MPACSAASSGTSTSSKRPFRALRTAAGRRQRTPIPVVVVGAADGAGAQTQRRDRRRARSVGLRQPRARAWTVASPAPAASVERSRIGKRGGGTAVDHDVECRGRCAVTRHIVPAPARAGRVPRSTASSGFEQIVARPPPSSRLSSVAEKQARAPPASARTRLATATLVEVRRVAHDRRASVPRAARPRGSRQP